MFANVCIVFENVDNIVVFYHVTLVFLWLRAQFIFSNNSFFLTAAVV